MPDEDKLRAFGRLVVKLQQREDLTRDEVREAYRQIWRNEQPELHQGAFIAALRAKGESQAELTGVVEAFQDEWRLWFPHVVRSPEPPLSIAGVGMDALKTINVSSGAAVLAAACGLYVHKPGAPALTGVSGAADMFALWGVDLDAPGEAQVKSTETCRLGFTSVVGRAFMTSGFARVISQIRIGTSFHIGGPLVRHVGERHKIAGVPEPRLVRIVCEVMRDLGYERALVPCAESRAHPGRYLDEIGNVGPTHVAELLPGGEIREYTIRPEDAGLREAPFEAIASRGTAEENARILARALGGKVEGPIVDVLLLNAAASLKLMGKVDSLARGVDQARLAIHEGRAIAQLRALIESQNPEPARGRAKLETLLAD
ncbi:hypothetical protein [Polyangium sp. 15x6]|uniref:anthranilate phosphoribosyltransferase n=1 Tax=Polyangium sp. 15x6 TaxID=3042687 RepID=UPI00249AEC98|nr:hypothetical protein [Polyangium sp. 15x6]MDI3290084.1 hypothetical protein [Polyangium sp. 15x6]